MKKSTVYIIVALFVVIIGGLVWWNLSQRQELNELVEQMTIEKEELEEEYEDLAIQFDGYQQMDIRNDSLQDLLSREQQRVQDLLEELRQTKASNARRIAELKNEGLCPSNRQPKRHQRPSDGRKSAVPRGEQTGQGTELPTLFC